MALCLSQGVLEYRQSNTFKIVRSNRKGQTDRRGVASDAHESTGKPEQAFQSAESALPGQDRPISGACAVLDPTTCYE